MSPDGVAMFARFKLSPPIFMLFKHSFKHIPEKLLIVVLWFLSHDGPLYADSLPHGGLYPFGTAYKENTIYLKALGILVTALSGVYLRFFSLCVGSPFFPFLSYRKE